MSIADRLQSLRKSKGISQEELADRVGVSRQAVSKWESGQSTPDIEKVMLLSDFFQVTTDHILKGTDPASGRPSEGRLLASRILYIGSSAFIAIGLFCAFGGWYAEQTMEAVFGALIIQVVGIAGYYIGKLLSSARPQRSITWINIIGLSVIPCSSLSGALSIAFFHQGWVAPYPNGIAHIFLFSVLFAAVAAGSYAFLFRRNRD